MATVSVDEARAQLPDLLVRVQGGEEIAIAERDRVVARLVPVQAAKPRRPGRLKGRLALTAAFFEPLPADERRAWEPE